MKTKIFFSAMLMAVTSMSFAQTISYVHDFNLTQSTVEVVPGQGQYVMSETIFDPDGSGDNQVHFVHYDQAGNIFPGEDKNIGDASMDERNVDLTYNPSNGEYLITTYSSPIGSGMVYVGLTSVDAAGNITMVGQIESTDPQYINLYALDAVYDPFTNQYLVSGTATSGGYDVSEAKVAFVAAVDAFSLNTNNLVFYDSDPALGSADDYDMAIRTVVVGPGRYYVTGGSNVDKNGNHVMGVRNMLIDPALMPFYDIPIEIDDPNSQENGVDMVEAADATGAVNFFVLVNSTSNNKWHFLRIDPGTGIPTNPFVETLFGYDSYGHSIQTGNGPTELVVSGMKYRYDGNCFAWNDDATPFMATIDIANPSLGTLLNHVEYNTIAGSSPYWNTGDFYAPLNGYPVPSFLNNFADREAPGQPYSVVTAINGPSGFLNTKYLDVDPSTNNFCDDILCQYGLDFNFRAVDVYPQITATQVNWNMPPYNPLGVDIPFTDAVSCPNYYKPTAVNNVGSAQLNIYPNPATSDVTVELNNSYTGLVTYIGLYDMTGKQVTVLHNGVVKESKMKFTLPESITTGIYILQIQAKGNETITEKITINR